MLSKAEVDDQLGKLAAKLEITRGDIQNYRRQHLLTGVMLERILYKLAGDLITAAQALEKVDGDIP